MDLAPPLSRIMASGESYWRPIPLHQKSAEPNEVPQLPRYCSDTFVSFDLLVHENQGYITNGTNSTADQD